jgi:hypothetical protein
MTKHLVAVALVLAGCSVDAAPIEVDLVVLTAGSAAPVAAGDTCTLRAQPAWRQGVNCQLVLRCGEHDLFGGALPGGYAVCEAVDGTLTTAVDDVAGADGDPAIEVDALARTIDWHDTADGTNVTFAFAGETRPTATW